jgi:hypothetical protein
MSERLTELCAIGFNKIGAHEANCNKRDRFGDSNARTVIVIIHVLLTQTKVVVVVTNTKAMKSWRTSNGEMSMPRTRQFGESNPILSANPPMLTRDRFWNLEKRVTAFATAATAAIATPSAETTFSCSTSLTQAASGRQGSPAQRRGN